MRIYLILLSIVAMLPSLRSYANISEKVLAVQAAQIEALKKANQELANKIDQLAKQDTATKLDTLRTQLQNGQFVVGSASSAASAATASTCGTAERANMLRARDDAHWLRFHTVDSKNRDVFELWRIDNTWHPTIATSDSLVKGTMSCYREQATEYAPGCSRPGYVNVLDQNMHAYSAGLETRWWRFCCAIQ
jgi:hypothetical protein